MIAVAVVMVVATGAVFGWAGTPGSATGPVHTAGVGVSWSFRGAPNLHPRPPANPGNGRAPHATGVSSSAAPAPNCRPIAGPAGCHTSSVPTTTTTTTPTTTTTSTSTSTTTTTTTLPTNPGGHWVPPRQVAWQWEIAHPLSLTSASDMGTGVDTFAGTPAPDPTVYDIDGILNPASTVDALHARGDRAVCYIEVGSAGDYYTAAQEGTTTTYYAQLQAAGDLGAAMQGYPEYYLDLRSSSTVTIIESMIRQQCAGKGFDAVEPDIDDSYTDSTGFPITEAVNVAFDTTLAGFAHSLGLGWAQKNGDDATFAAALEPTADFVLDEQCFQYSTCGAFAPYSTAGKAVLEVEYSLATSQFCPAANADDYNALLMNVNLSGGRQPCR